MIDPNIWQSQETRHDIFSSDDDEYMDNNQDSPVGTNVILRENIIIDQKLSLINKIEDWLHKNASWNDIAIQNKSIDYDLCTDLEMTKAIHDEQFT